MHYKNGREAKNGDKVVMITNGGRTVKHGILYNATPGNAALAGTVPNTSASAA